MQTRWLLLLVRVSWLILPVVLAGLTQVAVLRAKILSLLAIPLDGGMQWKGRPLLGPNKTWRGVLLMTSSGAVFTHLQSILEQRMAVLPQVTRGYRLQPWIAGGIVGLSYCLAELPNSFIKRRLGIPPGAMSRRAGRAQYVADQIDSVIGCLMALRIFYRPRRGEISLALVLGSGIHIAVDGLLYLVGVKRRGGY